MEAHGYVLALGSNKRHSRHGQPRQVLRAAIAALDVSGMRVVKASPILLSAPHGPSRRQYANGAVLVCTDLRPEGLLAVLKTLERQFGRRRGQRWGARVLDLDVVLWTGGGFASRKLAIPHRLFRQRDFVLKPAVAIAPDWRDPVTGLTLRQIRARLTRPRPTPR